MIKLLSSLGYKLWCLYKTAYVRQYRAGYLNRNAGTDATADATAVI